MLQSTIVILQKVSATVATNLTRASILLETQLPSTAVMTISSMEARWLNVFTARHTRGHTGLTNHQFVDVSPNHQKHTHTCTHSPCEALNITSICITVVARVRCPRLDDPDNGDVKHTGLTPGSKAIHSCDRGFVLKGNKIRICQKNGYWTGKPPVCKSELLKFYLYTYRKNHV